MSDPDLDSWDVTILPLEHDACGGTLSARAPCPIELRMFVFPDGLANVAWLDLRVEGQVIFTWGNRHAPTAQGANIPTGTIWPGVAFGLAKGCRVELDVARAGGPVDAPLRVWLVGLSRKRRLPHVEGWSVSALAAFGSGVSLRTTARSPFHVGSLDLDGDFAGVTGVRLRFGDRLVFEAVAPLWTRPIEGYVLDARVEPDEDVVLDLLGLPDDAAPVQRSMLLVGCRP